MTRSHTWKTPQLLLMSCNICNSKMSLICKLLGHAYKEGRTEQREIVEDENALLVDYNVRECSRCNSKTEEKVRTKIRNSDNENNNADEKEQAEPENNTSYSPPTELKTSEAQGGIIIKEPDESDNESDVESFAEQSDKEYVEEDGAVLYDQKSEDEQIIMCESCDYEELSSEPSRRTGDLCTECGGWLTVENPDTTTEEEN